MHAKTKTDTAIVNITEDEAALYDRQIRLWGLDAQRRLRGARVLLIGLGGLGAEVAKNIVLAGIKSIVLLDDQKVSKADFCSQFFLRSDDIDKNRAESSQAGVQQLNPMVNVTADSQSSTSKDAEFFKDFEVVCATNCSRKELLRINSICHKNNIKFYAGDVFGFYGYMFADLIHHEYAEEIPVMMMKSKDGEKDGEPAAKKAKPDPSETTTVKKETTFCQLEDALVVDWSTAEKLKAFKRTSSVYFIMQIVLEFQEKHGRFMDLDDMTAGKVSLRDLREQVLDRLKVPNSEIVPEGFEDRCFAALSPVCAIVGGIIGQEIIKAVSQKDPPHNNFFFFNGVDGNGLVDCIKV